MAKSELTYDEAYAELEKILVSLENDESSIDTLTGNVQRALELIKFCKERLKSTEQEIDQMIEE